MNSQFEVDKLKLLADSKKMLLLAQQRKFSELAVMQSQWQPRLEKMVNKYGSALESIRSVLLEDALILEDSLNRTQTDLGSALLKDLKANEKVKKFVQI